MQKSVLKGKHLPQNLMFRNKNSSDLGKINDFKLNITLNYHWANEVLGSDVFTKPF